MTDETLTDEGGERFSHDEAAWILNAERLIARRLDLTAGRASVIRQILIDLYVAGREQGAGQ